jgi:hypothetical protein
VPFRVVYFDLLHELKVRRDAFDVWYRFAEGRVPDRDELGVRARHAATDVRARLHII